MKVKKILDQTKCWPKNSAQKKSWYKKIKGPQKIGYKKFGPNWVSNR